MGAGILEGESMSAIKRTALDAIFRFFDDIWPYQVEWWVRNGYLK